MVRRTKHTLALIAALTLSLSAAAQNIDSLKAEIALRDSVIAKMDSVLKAKDAEFLEFRKSTSLNVVRMVATRLDLRYNDKICKELLEQYDAIPDTAVRDEYALYRDALASYKGYIDEIMSVLIKYKAYMVDNQAPIEKRAARASALLGYLKETSYGKKFVGKDVEGNIPFIDNFFSNMEAYTKSINAAKVDAGNLSEEFERIYESVKPK